MSAEKTSDARPVENVRQLSLRHTPAKSNFDEKLEGLSLKDVTSTTAVVSCQHAFLGRPTTPLVTPIYHSSTYIMHTLEDATPGIADGSGVYSRLANPTTEATEAALNTLERGAGSLTFSSGMAAVTSIFLGFLKSGDHVIYQIPSYPGTITALKHLANNFNIQLTPLKIVTTERLKSALQPNTKLVWLETPCNPDLVVVDIEAVVGCVQSKGILVGVDGTFASPSCQHAMSLGVDFSMHSATKYIGGHSDLIAGVVTTKTVEQWRTLKHIQGTFGNMLSPHDASLVLRGLKTLPLRMARHSETAMKVARYLENHPKVVRVSYPGLPSHPQHEIAKKQMTGFSGMIMAEIKGGEYGGATVAKNVRVFRVAVSLGCVRSILEHPYTMTHGPYLLSPEEIVSSGVTPGMLRISVGLEDAEDLIEDFKQALDKVLLPV